MLKEVPPYSTVVGVPGRVVNQNGERILDLDHVNLPDPVNEMIRSIHKETALLKKKVTHLELELEKMEAKNVGTKCENI